MSLPNFSIVDNIGRHRELYTKVEDEALWYMSEKIVSVEKLLKSSFASYERKTWGLRELCTLVVSALTWVLILKL
jgi:hypothetical protein